MPGSSAPPAGKLPGLGKLDAAERAPLSVVVSRRLRHAIVSGQVSSGTEMPSEKELTQELGVGRSTVREALRILQAQGLLSGGDTVSTLRPRVSGHETLSGAAAEAMANVLRLGRVALHDLVELRVVIEGAAVEQAAAAPRAEGLEEARAALAAMRLPGTGALAFRAADLRFHRALAVAAGNAAYPLVMGVLREAVSAHLGEALDAVEDLRRTTAALTRQHEAILAAVERGHGKRAAALMSGHIRGFYEGRRR